MPTGWSYGDKYTLKMFPDAEMDKFALQEWAGMPEFEQSHKNAPIHSINVHFYGEADIAAFALLLGQTVTGNTRSIDFPRRRCRTTSCFVAEDK